MKRRLAGTAMLVLFCINLAGCGAVAAVLGLAAVSAGTYVYVEGKLKRDYNVPLDRAYAASLEALQDLRITIDEKKKDLSEADINARDGEKSVWVRLDALDKDKTLISVRVGYTGDEQASKRIHEAIAKRLGVQGT